VAEKNHAQWVFEPELKSDEWVDGRIHSDPKIFDEELDKIFIRASVPVCHEPELPNVQISTRRRSHASRSSCAAGWTMKCARLPQRLSASQHTHRAAPGWQLPQRPTFGESEAGSHEISVRVNKEAADFIEAYSRRVNQTLQAATHIKNTSLAHRKYQSN
jgi:hypothetical protein